MTFDYIGYFAVGPEIKRNIFLRRTSLHAGSVQIRLGCSTKLFSAKITCSTSQLP